MTKIALGLGGDRPLRWRNGARLPAYWVLCLLLLTPAAQADTEPAPGSGNQVLSDGHSREEEVANIRKHHLHRLEVRLNTDAQELHRTCRYESDVTTPPPAKQIALTFDDGPEPGETELILETLKKHHISAAFFMIGLKAQRHPELVAKVQAAGHQVIGNHSWDHPNFHEIDVAEQEAEVLRNEEVLADHLQPKLFRYPYGNSTCATNDLVHTRGYRIVGWHIDSCDWAYDKTGSVDVKEAYACGVLAQYRDDYVGHILSAARARNGGIVLMHEIHHNTLKQLDEIITKLAAEGFEFGSLLDPGFAPSLR